MILLVIWFAVSAILMGLGHTSRLAGDFDSESQLLGNIGGVMAIIGIMIVFFNIAANNNKEQMQFNTKDLSGIVCNLEAEAYVLTGADLYLPSLLPYDDSIVMEIGADEEQIDLDEAGDYDVTYGVRLDARKLCNYLGVNYDKDKKTISDIFFNKTIHVVNADTALLLANQNIAVYTGTGSVFPKSDGTFPASEIEPESIEETGGNAKTEMPAYRRRTWTDALEEWMSGEDTEAVNGYYIY